MSPFHLDPAKYGPVVAGLLALPRLAPLGPGSPVKAVELGLRRFDVWNDLGDRVTNRDAALACHAGLWLYFDFLDESHGISQELENPDGSYWHGLMHRREPDHANAAYWFRRVGTHPVFKSLRIAAAELAKKAPPQAAFLVKQAQWDAFAFNDLCKDSANEASPAHELCRRVQMAEWELLFAWCFDRATGQAE